MTTLFNVDLSGLWKWWGETFCPWFIRTLTGQANLLVTAIFPFFIPLVKVCVMVFAFGEAIQWALATIADGLDQIDTSGIMRPDSTMLAYGAFINRFVPLVECFALTMVLASLWTFVVSVRWIKSFIPFFSN